MSDGAGPGLSASSIPPAPPLQLSAPAASSPRAPPPAHASPPDLYLSAATGSSSSAPLPLLGLGLADLGLLHTIPEAPPLQLSGSLMDHVSDAPPLQLGLMDSGIPEAPPLQF